MASAVRVDVIDADRVWIGPGVVGIIWIDLDRRYFNHVVCPGLGTPDPGIFPVNIARVGIERFEIEVIQGNTLRVIVTVYNTDRVFSQPIELKLLIVPSLG